MIKTIQFSLSSANVNKLSSLDSLFAEAKKVVNLYISKLWEDKNFSSKFVDFKVETWLSARMQQALGKQALEIVKSQRKKKKKSKPEFNADVINLDSRFFSILKKENSFDMWFKVQSLGNKLCLFLPAKQHKHLHTLVNKGFALKQSCRLRKYEDKYFLDLYAEKEAPSLCDEGSTLGVDCGYKSLLVDSNGTEYGAELEQQYEIIARKKQGSKAFKRALRRRDILVNQSINTLQTEGLQMIVAEDLKCVKHKSKGRIRKSFNKKLQRWVYPKVLDKLAQVCEERGIYFLKVDPAYTSQTCSSCGHTDKTSRNGKKFVCVACGCSLDADFNAAINIRNRGAYNPPALQAVL